MLFQVAFSAIFLKNRKLKRCGFPIESDKVWVKNLQIRQKTGFWRWCRDEVGKSEIFRRTSVPSQIDGRTKSELLAQLNEGFAEAVISDIVVR